MKRVLGVSLGSSTRNHSVTAEFLGQKFIIERIGTDGSMEKAIHLIKEHDGKVDAFGLGGIDLYIYAGSSRYTFRDAKKIAGAARLTPVVDGSSLKNTLERAVIRYLQQEMGFVFKGKKVLMVCAVDRFGMAEALWEAGADMIFGDLIFALGVPVSISSLNTLRMLARVIAPVVVKLPFKLLYPTGAEQEHINPKYEKYYQDADIIAGDFHFIRKYMPKNLKGKIIITNTVTAQDIALLKEAGITMLITTTPELEGRSFGTNVMEGVLVALAGKDPDMITPKEYEALLREIGFKPRVIDFSLVQAG